MVRELFIVRVMFLFPTATGVVLVSFVILSRCESVMLLERLQARCSCIFIRLHVTLIPLMS